MTESEETSEAPSDKTYKRVQQLVRDVLWKKCRFTTDVVTEYGKGAVYTMVVGDLSLPKNMGERMWKRYEKKIRLALNSKRNNVVDAMKKAFHGKCCRLTSIAGGGCGKADTNPWSYTNCTSICDAIEPLICSCIDREEGRLATDKQRNDADGFVANNQ